MKRPNRFIFILLGAILLLAGPVLAAQPRIGLKGGITFSSFYQPESGGNISETMNSFTGFSTGVAFQWSLPVTGLKIQPELLYTSKGSVLKGPQDSPLTINTGYVEIPVHLQWGLDLILFRPFLAVSPYIGYAVYQDWKQGFAPDIRWSEVNRFSYGVGIGGGFDVWRFQLQVRYNWSFGSLGDFPAQEGITDSGTAALAEFFNKSNYKGLDVSLLFFF